MRPFSDITANQIIPKALSPGFFFFLFFFLVGDVVVVTVVVVVDVADVCVCVWRGEVMKRVSVCVCVQSWGGGGGLQRQEDGRYNDHVPLHHAHQHLAPYTLVCTCILIMETSTPLLPLPSQLLLWS